MRIDTTKTYAEVPALRVRDLLRKLSWRFQHSWTPAELAEMSAVTPTDPTAFAAALLDDGLVRRVEAAEAAQPGTGWATGELVLTERGVAFGSATAGTVKRATATKALEGLLARAAEVNADPTSTYQVREIVLFGSYLHGTEDTIGDVDVAIELVKVRESQARTIGEMLAEPGRVSSRLRNRSRALSVVDLPSHRDWLADKPHRQVFFDADVRSLREQNL